MIVLLVKKNFIIVGWVCILLVRKILSVGVCRVFVILVRKVMIKNVVEVRLNDFVLEIVGELCMLVDYWKRKMWSLCCLLENK